MNRHYDFEKYIGILDYIREKMPECTVSSDIIVGFPTETEADFEDTMKALSRARFDMVYAFKYSPREGTRASKMLEAVDPNIKDERIARLLKLQDKISLENNEKYVGSEHKVLVDSLSKRKGKHTVNARTFSNKLVHFDGDESMIGKYINVKIERAGVYELYATKI
jgi:tRNA-2-methylthio-N6-dimethylallyladenosine synthase